MLAFSSSCKSFIVILTAIPCVIMAPACMSCKDFQQKGDQVLKSRRNDGEEKTPASPHGEIPRKGRNRCCPYDFNPTFCRYVDDRRLCGYNKNLGTIKSKDSIERLSGGCRLRGGRIECGYEQPPFNNPRRPSVWNTDVGPKKIQNEKNNAEYRQPYKNAQDNLRDPDSTVTSNRVTRCMETADNRIVCRDI